MKESVTKCFYTARLHVKYINMRTLFTLLFLVFFVVLSFPSHVSAQGENEAKNELFRSTTYPLPRFVSLASNEAYVRAGPGRKYPIKWILKKKKLPLEIILEYDHWRKVRDPDGQEGWLHMSLLSGRRTAITVTDASEESVLPLYKKSEETSEKLAYIEPGVIMDIKSCNRSFCRAEVPSNNSLLKGWVSQKNLWGVYADEEIED